MRTRTPQAFGRYSLCALATHLLAAFACSGGGSAPVPIADAGPSPSDAGEIPLALSITVTSPSGSVHARNRVVFQARVGGVPEQVTLEIEGVPLADLVPPYRYEWDLANWPEGRLEAQMVARRGDEEARSETRVVWVDRSPPFVHNISPAPGSRDLDIGAPIEIQLSEPVRTSSGAVRVRTSEGQWLAVEQSSPPPGDRLVIQLVRPVSAPTQLVVSLSEVVTDLAGNRLSPVTFEFGVPTWLFESIETGAGSRDLSVSGHTSTGEAWWASEDRTGAWRGEDGWQPLAAVRQARISTIQGATAPALLTLGVSGFLRYEAARGERWETVMNNLQGGQGRREVGSFGSARLRDGVLWYVFEARDAPDGPLTLYVGRMPEGRAPELLPAVFEGDVDSLAIEVGGASRPVVTFRDATRRHHIMRWTTTEWEPLLSSQSSTLNYRCAVGPAGELACADGGGGVYDVTEAGLSTRARFDAADVTTMRLAFAPDGGLYLARSMGVPERLLQLDRVPQDRGYVTPVTTAPLALGGRAAVRDLYSAQGRLTLHAADYYGAPLNLYIVTPNL